jgi:hypothetical protein
MLGFMPRMTTEALFTKLHCAPSPLESTRSLVVQDTQGDCRWQAPAETGRLGPLRPHRGQRRPTYRRRRSHGR